MLVFSAEKAKQWAKDQNLPLTIDAIAFLNSLDGKEAVPYMTTGLLVDGDKYFYIEMAEER